MVYTSGGSKGCGTCRARKVACDLNRPECQRCFTTGRKCSGYDLPRGFKVFTPENPRWHKPNQPGSRKNKGNPEEIGNLVESSTTPSREMVRSRDGPRTFRTPSPGPQDTQLFISLFGELFLPRNFQPESLSKLKGGWVTLLPTFRGHYKLLDDSLLALCAGYVGRHKNNARLKYIGTSLYVEALKNLLRKQTMWLGKEVKNAEPLLATIMVCTRCELVSTAGGDGYNAHIEGGLRLLRDSWHQLPKTGLSKLLIRKFRCVGFYIAIRHRKSFFMSSPPFNLIALAEREDSDYLFQTCVEAMITLPHILEEGDKLEHIEDYSESSIRNAQLSTIEILRLASVLDQKLSCWLEDMQQSVMPPVRLNSFPKPLTGGPRFSPVRLIYKSVVDGFLWTAYWAMSIYIHEIIKQLQARYISLAAFGPSGPLPETFSPANLGKSRAILDEYVENICGSVISELDNSTFTAHENMVGMFTAQWYYERRGESDKLQWCIEVLKMMEAEGLNLGVQVNEGPENKVSLVSKCLADR